MNTLKNDVKCYKNVNFINNIIHEERIDTLLYIGVPK